MLHCSYNIFIVNNRVTDMSRNITIRIRVTEKEDLQINEYVLNNEFDSISAFVRKAIKEKLKRDEVKDEQSNH